MLVEDSAQELFPTQSGPEHDIEDCSSTVTIGPFPAWNPNMYPYAIKNMRGASKIPRQRGYFVFQKQVLYGIGLLVQASQSKPLTNESALM